MSFAAVRHTAAESAVLGREHAPPRYLAASARRRERRGRNQPGRRRNRPLNPPPTLRYLAPVAAVPAEQPQFTKAQERRELREAARQFTDDALKTLAAICLEGQSEAARVSAACALLDRGYGKPTQQVETGSPGESAT